MTQDRLDAPGLEPDRPPDHLPTDPGRFWRAGIDLDDLPPPPAAETTPALELLGPMSSARPGFPLMGFLATVYEQVASHAIEAAGTEPHKPDRPAAPS